MQRRAAAVYAAFFLIVAAVAGAYGLLFQGVVADRAMGIVLLSVLTALALASLSFIPTRG